LPFRAQRPPPSWQRFRDGIDAADAVLFVTPEYNRSIPGVLKNALDMPVLQQPEMYIGTIGDKFNDAGEWADKETGATRSPPPT
jgi:NAD(P)H-dependent FMN reductase